MATYNLTTATDSQLSIVVQGLQGVELNVGNIRAVERKLETAVNERVAGVSARATIQKLGDRNIKLTVTDEAVPKDGFEYVPYEGEFEV